MVLLICSLGAVAGGSAALIAWLDLRRPLTVFTAFWVLLIAHLVGEALLAGAAIRQFHPVTLFVCALAVGAAEVALAMRRPGSLRQLGATAADSGRAIARGCWRHPVVAAFSTTVAAEYLWQAGQAVRLPQVAWDGLSYHLISPATWIQHGVITHTTQTIFSDTYPQDQELVSGWVGTFLHSLRYSGLTPFLFAAVGFGAVALLARGLGARRHLAVLAGTGFLAVPAFFLQVNTGYVDLASASTALAALAFVLISRADSAAPDYGEMRLIGYLFVAGCAAGLAAGTKTTNLVIVFAVLVVAIVQHQLAVRAAYPTRRPPSFTAPFWLVAAPVIALASFWYLRNWVTYRSPFYPVSIFGFRGLGSTNTLLIGANKPASLHHPALGGIGAILKSWANDLHRHSFAYDQRLGGFGLQWLIIAVPALILFTALLVRRRNWLYLFGLVAPVVVLFVATGAAWWARYSLALAGLGSVAVTACIQKLRDFIPSIKPRLAWLGMKLFTGALAFGYMAAAVVSMWWAISPTQIAVPGQGSYVHATPGRVMRLISKSESSSVYPWDTFQALYRVVSPGGTIALTATDSQPFTYPFVGPSLNRRLVRIGAPATAQELISMLAAKHATYVALDDTYLQAGLVRSVTANPERLRALTTGGAVNGSDIYQLGNWRTCDGIPMRIETAAAIGPDLIIRAQLADGCGPVTDAPVTLWQGPQRRPPWSKESRVLATAHTDSDGEVTFVVQRQRIPLGTILWTHFGGRTEPRDFRQPSASAPVATPTPTTQP